MNRNRTPKEMKKIENEINRLRKNARIPNHNHFKPRLPTNAQIKAMTPAELNNYHKMVYAGVFPRMTDAQFNKELDMIDDEEYPDPDELFEQLDQQAQSFTKKMAKPKKKFPPFVTQKDKKKHGIK